MTKKPSVVILAAGLGSRLRDVSNGLPKPLVHAGGRSLLERSLETLVAGGFDDVTVVVGYRGELVRDVARAALPGVSIVENPDAAVTGSMRSLALAWEASSPRPGRVLIVEGDLLYGPEALEALDGHETAVLMSGKTGAGDEVWVRGQDGRVVEIAKAPSEHTDVLGEFVGLSVLDAAAMDHIVDAHRRDGDASAMEHYEERISASSAAVRVGAVLAADLVWGEVDNAAQLARAESAVIPHLDGVRTAEG